MKNTLRETITQTAKKLVQLENNFDAVKVKKAVASLYEQLSVLVFLESQLHTDNTVEQQKAMDSKSFREENWFKEPEPLPQSEHKEDLIEPLMEKIKDLVAQMPEEADRVDDMLKEILPEKRYIKNDLEEFASTYQETPTFERKEATPVQVVEEKVISSNIQKSTEIPLEVVTPKEDKPKSINDSISNGLQIGLNDRLAFIKHLFNDNTEDYKRVLSQINSMHSFDEAATFIKGKVKPDYGYWLQKEEFAERFMGIVERSFN